MWPARETWHLQGVREWECRTEECLVCDPIGSGMVNSRMSEKDLRKSDRTVELKRQKYDEVYM